MSKITVRRPDEQELKKLCVQDWIQWECNPCEFDWYYVDDETCYVHKGRVIVKTADTEIEIKQGDLASFPKGLKCRWKVIEKIEKVYRMG